MVSYLNIFKLYINRMPAYNYNSLYSILFIGFLILNLYLFSNMVLAATSTSFKENLRVKI